MKSILARISTELNLEFINFFEKFIILDFEKISIKFNYSIYLIFHKNLWIIHYKFEIK